MDVMTIISSIITTGIPGFLSYIYLSRLGILNFTKDEKDEKIIVLSIFSLLNIGSSMIVFYYITKKKVSMDLEIESLILLFIIALVISIFLTIYIYPSAIKIANKFITDYQKSNNIANKSTKTIYENALFREDKKHPFIVIFDFDNKFIESGFAYRLSGPNEKLSFSLTNTTGHVNEIFDIVEILDKFEKSDDDAAELIIDVENKIKVFTFYF